MPKACRGRWSLTIHVLSQLFVVLLLRVQFEVHDISLVPLDLFVITNVDLFSTLGYQTHVVTNHQNSSFERVDTTG